MLQTNVRPAVNVEACLKKDLYYRSRLYVRKPWLLWTKNIRTSIYILSWRNVFMSRSGADLSVIVLTSNLHYSIISWRNVFAYLRHVKFCIVRGPPLFIISPICQRGPLPTLTVPGWSKVHEGDVEGVEQTCRETPVSPILVFMWLSRFLWHTAIAHSAAVNLKLNSPNSPYKLEKYESQKFEKITDSWECGREHNLRFWWRWHQPF